MKAIIITKLFLLFETPVILYLKCSVFINHYIIFLSAVSFLDNRKLESRPKSCSWFPTSIAKITYLIVYLELGECLGFTFTSFLNIDRIFKM